MLKHGDEGVSGPIPKEWRDYLLASRFGWTKQEIDDQPAVWLDWLISIDATVQEVKADATQLRD